jgi:hypothetical protein
VKLLLDENLPHGMREELPGHSVFTAAYMNWSGIGNGELLRLAAEAGFDALITNDRGLEYEQNPKTLPLAVIVIVSKANTIEAIRPLYPSLLDALTALQPRQFVKLKGS